MTDRLTWTTTSLGGSWSQASIGLPGGGQYDHNWTLRDEAQRLAGIVVGREQDCAARTTEIQAASLEPVTDPLGILAVVRQDIVKPDRLGTGAQAQGGGVFASIRRKRDELNLLVSFSERQLEGIASVDADDHRAAAPNQVALDPWFERGRARRDDLRPLRGHDGR